MSDRCWSPSFWTRGYKVDVVDLFWFGNHLPPKQESSSTRISFD